MRLPYLLLSIILVIYYYFLVFKHILTPLTGQIGYDPLYPVNLVIHEAGHMLLYPIYASGGFRITGVATLIYILAGSLLQWIMPILFSLYFLFKKNLFASSVCLFWVGNSLMSSVPYIADAKTMRIQLLANGLVHDWNYILVDLNLLESAPIISQSVSVLAITLLTISVLSCSLLSFTSNPPRKNTF
jgi:hypothetical protein